MKYYVNITTKEIVPECEFEEYVLEHLGITLEPQGENGTRTLEQTEFIENTIEWYFSGNWIEEYEKDEPDEPDLEYYLEMADRQYQDELDRKWGLI